MDFGALPPELTSARMYSGPGSAPMMAAASAWSALAAELNSAAVGYETVITQLAGEEWLGPGAASMTQAAAPYVAWLAAAAGQAEQAASQARSAAAAYEAALAATVPPPVIAANRIQAQSLQATNVFGQNTGALATLEAQYGAMWAQDTAAMYGYAGQSAAATQVTPFAAPVATTNAAGPASQAAAVAQAGGTSAGSTASTLSQAMSNVPTALQGMAAPAAAATAGTPVEDLFWQVLTGSSTAPTSLPSFLTAMQPYASWLYNTEGLPYFASGMGNNFIQASKTLGLIGGAPAAAGAAAGAAGAAAAGAAGAGAGSAGGLLGGMPVSAGLGDGALAGKLSVPPSWTGSTPFEAPPVKPVPVSTVSAAPEAGGAGNLLGGMPLAGVGGGAGAGAAPKYGFRPTVMARPPFAG